MCQLSLIFVTLTYWSGSAGRLDLLFLWSSGILPAYFIFYIFLLVLEDQRKYSEKSEICICLDPCFLNRFSLFGPIWITISLFIGCLVETRNYSILSLAFIASLFRVTEENLVFETVQSDP